ncbi:probable protein phosphatase CG10417 [Toxorhynchites rutilus septentrionalis]|uniref:probable protein phosphatase CG10417 n=1 Tax=Toxorhynchites rutilus septentrionalis TaxID=329112 RepID=UPI002479A549|nr:probable protein phosphatase CG10417 [Toxorhynchites rutilus septentrionalis]
MGAYLSEPLTTKDSSDEANDFLAAGSSSMQGWRISQEDAHNCILNFDEKTSFFAVYDGHGGAEVAQYCSVHLPTFLKGLEKYVAKNFEQALKDAFLGIDAKLLDNKVIEELKKLSDKTNGEDAIEEEDEDEEDYDDNVDDLCKEATMPLNEVLQMYKKNPALNKIKEGNCSKPASPFLKGKRKIHTDQPGPSSSNAGLSSAEADATSNTEAGASDTADSTVSSSSNKKETVQQTPESSSASDEKKVDQSDEISDTDGNALTKTTKEECAPDSSSSKADEEEKSKKPTPVINGGVDEAVGKSTVSSSSTSNQDNGVASSNSVSCTTKNTNNVDTSPASSSSISASLKKDASNGPGSSLSADSTDDDDDDDTESDGNPTAEGPDETSSTEDGEDDNFCEDASDDEEEMDDEEFLNEEDEAFMNNITDEPGKDSGCTAVVALLHDKDLYVANAGDSRCVVCRNGKALDMSFDHKPEDQIEFDRIQNAGGRVTLDGRVNGGLNLSRAIGDHGYKMNKKLPPEDQMISAMPDIKRIAIEPEDEFMVLACDGIWNFMTSDDVVEFVQERISDPTKKLSEICEEMFDYCLAPHTKGDGTGCDNMTAIIVQFKPSYTDAVSRKRAASLEPETYAIESDCKKAKTEQNARSSTSAGSNGCTSTKGDKEEPTGTTVESVGSSLPTDTNEDAASSST